MDPILIGCGVALLIIIIIVIMTISIYNKYQFAIIKINEAENNIDMYLQKKMEYLTRLLPLLKENLKEGYEDFEKVVLLKSRSITSFELNERLEKSMHQFLELLDLNAELEEVDSIMDLQNDLEENEDDLEAAKKYYNDNVTQYNKLVRSIPSNFVGLIFHYKHKDFYSNEKEEMFEILKK